jgi:hypothetical protein
MVAERREVLMRRGAEDSPAQAIAGLRDGAEQTGRCVVAPAPELRRGALEQAA